MRATPVDSLLLILDTTVLSNFAAVGRIDLLAEYCSDHAATTAAVVQEVEQGLGRGYHYLGAILDGLLPQNPNGWLNVVILDSPEERLLQSESMARLGRGEASCLAVAISRGMTLATDDLAARLVARTFGVRLTGTLGILVRLLRTETISLDDGNSVLWQMIEEGYRSPVRTLDELL